MASDFEKQQRWQALLFGLGLAAIAIGAAWLLSGHPLPGGGGW